MEQKLILVYAESPGGSLTDVTSDGDLKRLLSEGWKIEQFSVTPGAINDFTSEQHTVPDVIVAILLSR